MVNRHPHGHYLPNLPLCGGVQGVETGSLAEQPPMPHHFVQGIGNGMAVAAAPFRVTLQQLRHQFIGIAVLGKDLIQPICYGGG